MKVSIIVAVGENNVIGIDKKLPWHLPADMKYFKEKTMGHHVVMGRVTYESLKKPLKGRTNIIVTRKQDFEVEGYVVVHHLDDALRIAEKQHETECFIIGGAEIFREVLRRTDRIYLTRIFHHFEGDTFFPSLDPSKWKVVSEQSHEPDDKNRYPYSFLIYEKIFD
jgi:dihydrofolate reductase